MTSCRKNLKIGGSDILSASVWNSNPYPYGLRQNILPGKGALFYNDGDRSMSTSNSFLHSELWICSEFDTVEKLTICFVGTRFSPPSKWNDCTLTHTQVSNRTPIPFNLLTTSVQKQKNHLYGLLLFNTFFSSWFFIMFSRNTITYSERTRVRAVFLFFGLQILLNYRTVLT